MSVKIHVKYAEYYVRAFGLFFNTQNEVIFMGDKDKPKPVPDTTALIHPPVKPAERKGSRVTGVLK
jgi:hypothetical protein